MSAFLQLLPGDVDLVHLTLELQSGTHLMISSNRIDVLFAICQTHQGWQNNFESHIFS